jgi:hypothetical protein
VNASSVATISGNSPQLLGLAGMRTPQSTTVCFRRSPKLGNTHFDDPSLGPTRSVVPYVPELCGTRQGLELCSSEEVISLGSGLGIRKEMGLFLRALLTFQIRRLGISATQ